MLGSAFSTWASETKRIAQTRSVVRQILEKASSQQAEAEEEIVRLQTELAACNASLYEVATAHGEQMEKREKVIMDEVQELSRKFRQREEEVQRNLQELTVKASVLEKEKKKLEEEMEHARRSESDRRERALERAREREEQEAEREREIEEERIATLERISIERREMEREISQARETERRLRESLAEAWKELKDRKEDWDDSKVMSLTWSLGLCLGLRLCVSFLRHCRCVRSRHVVVDGVQT
jgi:chromosome segregation ATPase